LVSLSNIFYLKNSLQNFLPELFFLVISPSVFLLIKFLLKTFITKRQKFYQKRKKKEAVGIRPYRTNLPGARKLGCSKMLQPIIGGKDGKNLQV